MAFSRIYHTNTDPEDPVHHIYDDCPAGERVSEAGNQISGDGGYCLCDFCANKQTTGKLTAREEGSDDNSADQIIGVASPAVKIWLQSVEQYQRMYAVDIRTAATQNQASFPKYAALLLV